MSALELRTDLFASHFVALNYRSVLRTKICLNLGGLQPFITLDHLAIVGGT